MKVTAQQWAAIEDAMGYRPWVDVVTDALETYGSKDPTDLREELDELEGVFTELGGRGVELADTIDRMRIALALHAGTGASE